MDNDSLGTQSPNSKKTKNILWLPAVAVILIVLVYFGFKFYESYKIAGLAPGYFTDDLSDDRTIIKAEKTELTKLTPNENLAEDAAVFVVNKLQKEVLQDFYNKIVQND